MKIACVGDNCVDYYDNTGEAFPGGNPVNVAVYVRRMGGQSAYLGAVGSDEYGVNIFSFRTKVLTNDRYFRINVSGFR